MPWVPWGAARRWSSWATASRCRRRRLQSRPAIPWTTWRARVTAVEDMESILSECVEARVPRQWLSWHYRSQDESLIAFSNQQYYDSKLSSFPGPSHGAPRPRIQGHGVNFVRVDGQFHRSGPSQGAAHQPRGGGRHRRGGRSDGSTVASDVAVGRRRHVQPAAAGLIEGLFRDTDDERIIKALDERSPKACSSRTSRTSRATSATSSSSRPASARTTRAYLPLNFGPLNRPAASGGSTWP